jgi:hydrogenase-4 component B
MGSTVLLAAFLALCAAGIVVAAILPDRRVPAAVAWIGAAASLALLAAGAEVLAAGREPSLQLWTVPSVGSLALRVDRLSGVFAVIAGLVYLPVSIFSAGYMERCAGRYSLKWFGALYFTLFAAAVLVLAADDALTFLLAWEGTALASYLLVNYEHERDDATRSGYLMLAMGEAGTLAIVVAVLLLAGAAGGGLSFDALRGAGKAPLTDALRWAVFLLSFFGFGVKAGLVPLNTWLPPAYAAAGGNVSALLSGVTSALGVYGIIRINLDLLPVLQTGPGVVVLVTGSVSALMGILYATTNNDMKAMLAHSSIENIGIVAASLGAGMTFAAAGHPVLAGIAYIVALYHVGNHSLFKALLFLGAGSVEAAAGGRDMDRLGGLLRRMPWTGLFFLAGALSISAMPPMNGFVSEWLTLQTLLRSAELSSPPLKAVFALCGAALALTAALAITCFVKAFAMSFLGMPRSAEAGQASEVRPSMAGAMAVLAGMCLAAGVLPTYIIPVLGGVIAPFARANGADALVPPFFAPGTALPPAFVAEFHSLGAQVGRGIVPGPGLVVLHRGGTANPVVFAMSTAYMLAALLLLLGLTAGVVRLGAGARAVVRRSCWDGGLPRLLPGMTYTATGFSNPVRVIFNAVFHPSAPEETVEVAAEHFRTAVRKTPIEEHLLERLLYEPAAHGGRTIAGRLARMHHGRINTYAGYVLLTLLVFLALGRLL